MPNSFRPLLLILTGCLLGTATVVLPPIHARSTSSATQTREIPAADTLTIREAFSHDTYLQADIVHTLQRYGYEVTADSPVNATQAFGGATPLILSDPRIRDYQDLRHLVAYPRSLRISNQTHLAGAGFRQVIAALNQLPAEADGSFLLYRNQLTDADLSVLVDYLKTLPSDDDTLPVHRLNLSENQINDLTPVADLADSTRPGGRVIRTLVAWGQSRHLNPLPAQRVVHNQITLKANDLLPLRLYHHTPAEPFDDPRFQMAVFRVHPELNADGLHALTTDSFVPNALTAQEMGQPVLQYRDIPMTQPEPKLTIDEGTKTVSGLANFGVLDYQNTTPLAYRQWLSPAEQASRLSSLAADGYSATDSFRADPQITNIPSGTPFIQVRAAFRYFYSETFRGFTQDYTIPLTWPDTSTSSSSSGGSNSGGSTSSSRPSLSSGGDGDGGVPEGTVVTATRKIGLYTDTAFKRTTRQHYYRRQPRVYRPMFKVTGHARSVHGTPRYLVKDVNHHSKTAGKTGYITVNRKFVTPTYYRQAAKRVTVINPNGVNAYRSKSLTGKATHYRQGQTLRVKKLVKHNLTTRYVLTNGHYITANKKLVQNGRVAMPKKLKAKTAINRYRDVNFQHRQKHYRKDTTLTVKGWDFSAHGTKRYRVAHGYVTANRHYTKTIN
ncbi:DUF5776 domain-containing protein [Levilactobacillus lanxiensis]|uniref:DUF5776 domain-containing protein n=1 Tax=Levilactobacillus lanxiensis TaxID=2799568 RepID=A0ABW4CYF5_9LACO|nr:DUF5776 domain-containing protein [Levilactobacillus lanxiensis]